MKEVYIVKMFDGESSYILGVFLSKDKANEYANEYEKAILELEICNNALRGIAKELGIMNPILL